jgi:hypothetical protein
VSVLSATSGSHFSCKFNFLHSWPVTTVDYTCADGRFLMSPRGVTVSNLVFFLAVKLRLILAWNAEEDAHFYQLIARKQLVVFSSAKNWRATTSTSTDNFKLKPKRDIFKFRFWLNGSFFRRDDRNFLKEESQTLSNGTDVASQLVNLFFFRASIVYGYCRAC